MAKTAAELVAPFFDALNTRDATALEALCDERIEIVLLAEVTAGRGRPYVSRSGLRELLADAETDWEELLLTATGVLARDDVILVTGRIHARSRELGVRDLPAAWVFRIRDGRFVWGRVFPDVDAAVEAVGDGWSAMRSPH
jgi:ketosteroid isomerase-like protein